MKNRSKFDYYSIPVFIWLVIIPIIVKIKLLPNPLMDASWYSSSETIADFFLYYKSLFVTIVGAVMLGLLIYLISQKKGKDKFLNTDTKAFIPLTIYLLLAVLSSIFSEYGYFCIHGMPDQFETIWNLLAYGIVAFYCYNIIEYHQCEHVITLFIYIAASIVGMICFLQFLNFDIYRLIYSSENYEFTFPLGSVYGPFYNINYVGAYVLLFIPIFILALFFIKDWKTKLVSAILSIVLLVSMYGAQSSTAWIALAGVVLFTIYFLLLKNVKERKILRLPLIVITIGIICSTIIISPKINSYIQASNTERHNLENIYTHDDNVEIDYKGHQLFISMSVFDESFSFSVIDENQKQIDCESSYTEDGHIFYTLLDDRFSEITLMPSIISDDPVVYGFVVDIDDKNWWFTNELTDTGDYYYFTDWGKITKLTEETPSPDFKPLENVSGLANGRGYIWNKTITLLKDYIILGSGADTYTLVFPNDDFVDLYNNGYENRYLTKPHCMYLQIAIQTGMLSLICFLVFYIMYLVSSIKIYFKKRFDNPLTIIGFAIMLGTIGYMLSGLANDSTITVAPVFWALIGVGIGINHRIRVCTTQDNK